MRGLTTWLTAAAAIAAGAFALWQGLAAARFGRIAAAAERALDPARRPGEDELPAALRAAAAAADLRDWRDAPGPRDEARALYLAALVGGGRAAAHEIEAAAIDRLAASPASPLHWILLAEARLAGGAPESDVVAALEMSAVAGPREAAAMWLRARLSLRIWAALDAAARGRAVTELAALRPALDPARLRELRALVDAQPAPARDEIRTLLSVRRGGAPLAAALGL